MKLSIPCLEFRTRAGTSPSAPGMTSPAGRGGPLRGGGRAGRSRRWGRRTLQGSRQSRRQAAASGHNVGGWASGSSVRRAGHTWLRLRRRDGSGERGRKEVHIMPAFTGPSRRASGAPGADPLSRYRGEQLRNPHVLILEQGEGVWLGKCSHALRVIAETRRKEEARLESIRLHPAIPRNNRVLSVSQNRNECEPLAYERSRHDGAWQTTCSCKWKSTKWYGTRDDAIDAGLAHWYTRHG